MTCEGSAEGEGGYKKQKKRRNPIHRENLAVIPASGGFDRSAKMLPRCHRKVTKKRSPFGYWTFSRQSHGKNGGIGVKVCLRRLSYVNTEWIQLQARRSPSRDLPTLDGGSFRPVVRLPTVEEFG
jgi:hypothetical protein